MAGAVSIYGTLKQFKDEYAKNGGKIENYQAEQCIVAIDEKLKQSIECTGFMGAGQGFILRSATSYSLEAPAFAAANYLTIIATNALNLGVKGRGDHPQPVQIYAPQLFNLSALHISIGDVRFLEQPLNGVLACKKLTLPKTMEEDPAPLEVMKSWVKYDDTEIEFSVL
jgi:hypothetical protein